MTGAAGRVAEPSPSVGVSVDWQALDALPPAMGAAKVIVLRPPARPKIAGPPAAPQSAIPPPPAPKSSVAAVIAPPRPPAPKAAVRPATAPGLVPGRVGMVPFPKGQVDIPPGEVGLLDSVAQELAADGKARLQLIAYASGNADDLLAARRISLARAVQMRAYLIQKGVPSVRMDVRALGDRNAGDGPADRVDLVIVER
jgi:outer membrane protein OmpA-like peptidoglycan-associated protein